MITGCSTVLLSNLNKCYERLLSSVSGHKAKWQNPAICQAIMNPMKSLSLIVCLILTVGYLTPVQAVTDAELDALEKQIEQL